MLHKPLPPAGTPTLPELSFSVEEDGGFPHAAFAQLHAAGLIGAPPLAPESIGTLLHLLARIGQADLSVGRIYEGHVNALMLIAQYGTPAQVADLSAMARRGGLLGVWNTDLPDDPLRVEAGHLAGRKSFASGVDGLSRAIVTVSEGGERQMMVVPLDAVRIDRDWWKPLGMRASGSHVVDFGGLAIEDSWRLGDAEDYVREPWFSAGAMRFAAVQAGGLRAAFDAALAQLNRSGRSADPYQSHRIARMAIAAETANLWIDRAAAAWRAMSKDPAGQGSPAIAVANAMRSVVEMQALQVLKEAERGIGFAGLMAPHPLERIMRDLRTYLRQPNPDGALASVGRAVSDGQWRPDGIDRC